MPPTLIQVVNCTKLMEDLLDRIKTAIIALREGLPFRVGDLFIGIDQQGIFNVTSASQCISLKNITKQSAVKELSEIKRLFSELLNMSTDFRIFVSSKEIQ